MLIRLKDWLRPLFQTIIILLVIILAFIVDFAKILAEAIKIVQIVKPCSLMMFSIIDGFFIRNEGEKRADEKNLSVGLKAGIRVLESIRNSYNQQKSFVELCFLENLIECQKTLVAYGDDFKVQPQVINRNFIDHGMYDAKVNKIDYSKLFTYYYNGTVGRHISSSMNYGKVLAKAISSSRYPCLE